MEFRDALKLFRCELGLTQSDLSTALRVNASTITRWEMGKTFPNRSTFSLLLEYAGSRSTSKSSIRNLARAYEKASKRKFKRMNGELYTVEHASLSQLVDNASFPIYVVDIKTDELLYMNRKAEQLAGEQLGEHPGIKCYQCISRRTSPCPYCHKDELNPDEFVAFDAFRPDTRSFHRVFGKTIRWNGRNAQIRYMQDLSGAVNVAAASERETAFRNQFRIRRENAVNALASARYNLTQDTVSEVGSINPAWSELISSETLDKMLARVRSNAYAPAEQRKLDKVQNRQALLQSFYQGTTHISVKHYNAGLHGYFEATFDMMQNPVSYDVEAFATLQDITQAAIQEEIAKVLLGYDYESIATIDAETGEALPYIGNHLDAVKQVQQKLADNVDGVSTYLRKHCIDDDLDRVLQETSLPYVKQRLETEKFYTVTYTLSLDGKRIRKRVLYTYLGVMKALILCAMQDITDTYRESVIQHDRLSAAVEALREISGVSLARYDLDTMVFHNAGVLPAALRYAEEIANVPEAFIRDGLVPPESVDALRSFCARLRQGENAAATAQLRAATGALHSFRASAKIVRDENGQPCQAVVAYQDMDT